MQYSEKITTLVNVCNFQTMMADNPRRGVQSHTQSIAISTLIAAVTKSSPVNVVPFQMRINQRGCEPHLTYYHSSEGY